MKTGARKKLTKKSISHTSVQFIIGDVRAVCMARAHVVIKTIITIIIINYSCACVRAYI